MSETLTPKQTLLLWCLLARQGVAAQAEIEPAVAALDRKALERRGFVSVAKDGRRLVLRLEDEGWAWASDHLGDPLPKSYGALRDFLMLLRRHLDQAGEDLGGFIGTPPVVTERESAQGKGSAKKVGVKKKPSPSRRATPGRRGAIPSPPTSLRQNIETAYLAITDGKKGVDAKLSDLRQRLPPSFNRTSVDAELRAMQSEGMARLMRSDYRHAISAADEEAALRHAGEAFHILWIFE